VWLSPWTSTTGPSKALTSSSSAALNCVKPEGVAVSSSKGLAWITSIIPGLLIDFASSNVSASHSRLAALQAWSTFTEKREGLRLSRFGGANQISNGAYSATSAGAIDTN
jgi:hypothetical protein